MNEDLPQENPIDWTVREGNNLMINPMEGGTTEFSTHDIESIKGQNFYFEADRIV